MIVFQTESGAANVRTANPVFVERTTIGTRSDNKRFNVTLRAPVLWCLLAKNRGLVL